MFLVLSLFALVALAGYIVQLRRTEATRAAASRERLRLEHERFLAELRLHTLTNSALSRLLNQARPDVERSDHS